MFESLGRLWKIDSTNLLPSQAGTIRAGKAETVELQLLYPQESPLLPKFALHLRLKFSNPKFGYLRNYITHRPTRPTQHRESIIKPRPKHKGIHSTRYHPQKTFSLAPRLVHRTLGPIEQQNLPVHPTQRQGHNHAQLQQYPNYDQFKNLKSGLETLKPLSHLNLHSLHLTVSPSERLGECASKQVDNPATSVFTALHPRYDTEDNIRLTISVVHIRRYPTATLISKPFTKNSREAPPMFQPSTSSTFPPKKNQTPF